MVEQRLYAGKIQRGVEGLHGNNDRKNAVDKGKGIDPQIALQHRQGKQHFVTVDDEAFAVKKYVLCQCHLG